MILMKLSQIIVYFQKQEPDLVKNFSVRYFKEILKKAISYSLVTKDKVLVGSTIVKASASLNSLVDVNLNTGQN